jgi:prepilin-type N-terminal cleavage/methylation domain-containing protein
MRYTPDKNAVLGFTLIEITVVLVILGLLLSLTLPPLAAQRELTARTTTQSLLEQAKEALIGHAVMQGYMPCPDTDAVPDGIENRKSDGSGNCSANEGVLPWNSLGIDATDAWQHYLRYRVDSTFANNTHLFSIADANSASSMDISGDAGSALISSTSRPAAIVLSHGANGWGSMNTNASALSNKMPAPKGADELENADGDTSFVSRAPSAKDSSNEFDDMLVWISPKVLINRMIVAERLP